MKRREVGEMRKWQRRMGKKGGQTIEVRMGRGNGEEEVKRQRVEKRT